MYRQIVYDKHLNKRTLALSFLGSALFVVAELLSSLPRQNPGRLIDIFRCYRDGSGVSERKYIYSIELIQLLRVT